MLKVNHIYISSPSIYNYLHFQATTAEINGQADIFYRYWCSRLHSRIIPVSEWMSAKSTRLCHSLDIVATMETQTWNLPPLLFKTHHNMVCFLRTWHSKPGMESYCSSHYSCTLHIFKLLGRVLKFYPALLGPGARSGLSLRLILGLKLSKCSHWRKWGQHWLKKLFCAQSQLRQ